jgi:hypothetical protein
MPSKGTTRGRRWGKVCLTVLSAAATLAVTSCKKAPPGAAHTLSQLSASAAAGAQSLAIAGGKDVSVDGGNSFAHVTYAPAVKMFEDSEVRSSLMGISSDGHGFLFQNASAGIRALKAGDVLMVKGELAVKVLGMAVDGDKTLVLCDQASVRDLVHEGEININAPVKFHGPKRNAQLDPSPLLDRLRDLIEMPVYAQSGLPGSTADVARQQGSQDALQKAASNIASFATDGWKVTKWSVEPGDGEVNFSLVMAKDTGGFVAMVAMKGWLGNFDFVTDLKISGLSPQQIAAEANNMQLYQGVKNTNGNIQFDWEIGKATPGVWAAEDRVKLPAGLSVPLAPLLAGMPLTLDVSSALLIHPALTGGSEYSRGGFAVSWGGNGNFESKGGGAVSGDSNITTTYQVTADNNVSPIAPNGMVISYCAPRIELRLDVLGPFAKTVASAGSQIDQIVSKMESFLPQNVLDAVAKSPLSKVTASNILSSNADVFVQFIATEGVTHSSNQTPVPCSKQEIKFTGQGGTSAQFFGLTDGAKTITDLFTKTYTRWDPPSSFCKGV